MFNNLYFLAGVSLRAMVTGVDDIILYPTGCVWTIVRLSETINLIYHFTEVQTLATNSRAGNELSAVLQSFLLLSVRSRRQFLCELLWLVKVCVSVKKK